jgi:acyl carrier protein
MAHRPEAELAAKMGALRMPPEAAIGYLGRVLGAPRAHCVVAEVDWAVFKQFYEARRRRPLLAMVNSLGSAPAAEHDLRALASHIDLASLPAATRRAAVRSILKRELCAVLSGEVGDTQLEQRFDELGLDSLGAVQLRNRIQALLQTTIEPTAVFDHPSLGELVEFCDAKLGDGR